MAGLMIPALRHRLHHVTHEHSMVRKGDATVVLCRRRRSKRAVVFFQPWEGALWEQIESGEELTERLLGGSTNSAE